MTPRIDAQQLEHRAELLGALFGPGPGDGDWQQISGRYVTDEPTPRLTPRRRKATPTAETDQDPLGCPACRTRKHGPDCEAGDCPCKCRAMLGLEGPFDLDPFAVTLAEVPDPDEEWVA